MNQKKCPTCNVILNYNTNLYWCYNCKKWLEEIDFLTEAEREKCDSDCRLCSWLVETAFKKNDQTIYYCNNMKTDRAMEKMNDFRKCSEISYKELFLE